MIPTGSLYSVQVSGKAGSLWAPVSPGDVQTAITGELQAAGFAPIAVVVHSTDLLPGITSFSWSGTLAARTTFDYMDDADIAYQLAQAVQRATGYPCAVSNPATGDPGQPDARSPWDVALQSLQQDAGYVLLAIVGLAVLVVVIGGKDAIKAAVR